VQARSLPVLTQLRHRRRPNIFHSTGSGAFQVSSWDSYPAAFRSLGAAAYRRRATRHSCSFQFGFAPRWTWTPCAKSGVRTPQIYFACSCASNITFRVPSSNSPVVDFSFRSDPSMGVSLSVGGLYATGGARSNPDVSSVSSISPEFRTVLVDRSWMRLFRLSIFFGLGGGV
jgi:hypothetical protein